MSKLWENVKFSPGRIVITANASEQINAGERIKALTRHLSGDWGDVDDHDREENERSLRDGCRLLSVYHTTGGVNFWIITEHDRSVTTILMPEDY